jgi:HNH endonuclease
MPFSASVKSKALTGAAGHCCVCHRFEAGHVEVHHILPQAEGGSDDMENAIALCYDCHTWAGHYNPNHPKGSRYSPHMLRAAKNAWYKNVAFGPIAPAEAKVQVRYLISRDHSVSTRLLEGDLSLSPIKDAILASNEIGKFCLIALRLRKHGSRSYTGDSHPSIADYHVAYSEAKCDQHDLGGFAYYDCRRECRESELTHRVLEDKLSLKLQREAVPATDLCVVVAKTFECGSDNETVFETYLTRPTWVVFVALTNLSDRPIVFDQLTGGSDVSEAFRALEVSDQAAFSLSMPACEVSAQQTILVPLALLMAPIEELGESQVEVQVFSTPRDSVEVMNLTDFSSEHLSQFRLYGPAFWPKQIELKYGGTQIVQKVHPFASGSAYTLDRVWLCGSCPHLFVIDDNRRARYVGELIPLGERVVSVHKVNIPAGTTELEIAELEDEESFFSQLSIDGKIVLKQTRIRKGDVLRFSVSGAKSLQVIGAYFPTHTEVSETHGPETRNRLICQFLSGMRSMQPAIAIATAAVDLLTS